MKEFAVALHKIITQKKSRSEDNILATENAISAVGKILRYQAAALDSAVLLPTWLSYLPVSADDEEGPIIYDALCFFIEKQHPHLWGAKLERLPHIVSVLVDAYGSDLVN